MKQFIGTGVAIVTPFTSDFAVDVDALRAIVRYCIDGGVDYLVVLGTTGEAATLSKSEKQLVMKTVADENAGQLPLVVGIGGNNTARLVEELKSTNLELYDGILSVSPYYNKPTQEGIYQHFGSLAKASPKPIILYNVPGRTGSNVLPETVARLAKDFDSIAAVKEASGDIEQIRELIRIKPASFQVIAGDDFNALPTIAAGGVGVISVLGQGLPVEFSKMIRAALNGELQLAHDLEDQMKGGMELIFKEGNPAGIKAIFELLGLSKGLVRLPLVAASAELKAQLGHFMKAFTKIQV